MSWLDAWSSARRGPPMSEHDMRRLQALLSRRFGLQWVDIMEWLRSEDADNNIDAIEGRVRSGQWGNIIANLDDAALRIAAESHADYITAAQKQAEWLDNKIPGALVRFEPDEGPVVQRARANKLELVRGFREEANQVTRQIVQRAMVEGAQGGINPRQVARDFRDSLGLTAHQENIVANYRRSLERGDYSRALGYELSDGNADRTVRAAQRDGRALSPAQVDAMTEKYRRNMIAYRATTIARTEGLRNAEQGSADAIRQAIRRGQIDADELVVTWHAGPRTRDARDDHRKMDGESVKFGEDFQLPDGTKMSGPGDPRGGAKHNANCRCTSSTTINPKAKPEERDERETLASTPPAESAPPTQPAKNPRRVAAARVAAAASVERRREIHSAARSNLPRELHATWDKEGHKFMREEAARIRGIKDRVNAASEISQAFAEKYGTGESTMFGNEGDRSHRRSEIEAEYGVAWADEQERRYYAEQARLLEDVNDEPVPSPTMVDDDDPPF